MICFGISILCFSHLSNADELQDIIQESSILLNVCSDPKVGYKIKCNPDWIITDEPKSVSILILDDPELLVTATISKSDQGGISLSSLTPDKLRMMGQYGPQISTENVKIGGKDAIRVKATAVGLDQMQLLDYYVVKDGYLYSIFFAVNPAERFKDFQELFDVMIQSYEFIDS